MSLTPNVFPTSAEDLARILNTPNVWRPRSVKDEPKTTMSRWSVKECFTKHYGERTRHLVGYTGEGRVSSKVVNWEIVEEGILATTNSGRKYLLKSFPGINMDASYVWASWVGINDAKDVVDVSYDYWDDENSKPKLPTQ